jgi:hypothetical protein
MHENNTATSNLRLHLRLCQPDVYLLPERPHRVALPYLHESGTRCARLSPNCRALAAVVTTMFRSCSRRSRSVVPTARSKDMTDDEPDRQPSRGFEGGAERRNAIHVRTRESDSMEAFLFPHALDDTPVWAPTLRTVDTRDRIISNHILNTRRPGDAPNASTCSCPH